MHTLCLNFFFFDYLSFRDLGLTPLGTYNPNASGSDACRGNNRLWTLDRYTRAGLPECVVSAMSGSPPETTQDRTQTKETPPIPGQKFKFLIPPGIEPGRRVGRQGLYWPRQGDGCLNFFVSKFFTENGNLLHTLMPWWAMLLMYFVLLWVSKSDLTKNDWWPSICCLQPHAVERHYLVHNAVIQIASSNGLTLWRKSSITLNVWKVYVTFWITVIRYWK